MIAEAERYLVTNAEVSLKRRAAREFTAPWNKDDTVRFLKTSAAGSTSRSKSTEEELRSASTYSSTHGSVGRGMQDIDTPVPGWRKVWEQARSAKAARKAQERMNEDATVKRSSWESLGRELERATLINQMRGSLNVDLLKVAEEADRSFKDNLSEYKSSTGNNNNNNNNYIEDDQETCAQRADVLENIANSLSVSF